MNSIDQTNLNERDISYNSQISLNNFLNNFILKPYCFVFYILTSKMTKHVQLKETKTKQFFTYLRLKIMY
jgi:hypothetical protein